MKKFKDNVKGEVKQQIKNILSEHLTSYCLVGYTVAEDESCMSESKTDMRENALQQSVEDFLRQFSLPQKMELINPDE